MLIPTFPEFAPLSLDMRSELHPRLLQVKQGVSEFTFANIYLFRDTYSYKTCMLPDGQPAVSGVKNNETFIMLPFGIPSDKELLCRLFDKHIYIKNLAQEHVQKSQIQLEQMGFCIVEDRDNFDYIYLRKDLANLEGKKYHKKRNLVKQFINNYEYREEKITGDNIGDVYRILDEWTEGKDDEGDTVAAREALDRKEELELCGYVYYVDSHPAAYVLGESLARGKGFVVHFEKAVGTYKGIYQFINKAFASILPGKFTFINREQDLGDPGLRQAKMTYRPSGFIKKYRVYVEPSCPCLCE
ncbi:MAG: DUF2156 domain-containing protein [Spirochaetales bacterium]|nr:DUF2156 domain-containing protein [Spirochaetales bacterium]